MKVYPQDMREHMLNSLVTCPYAFHYHVGDKIEIELEMILCAYDAGEVFRKIWG